MSNLVRSVVLASLFVFTLTGCGPEDEPAPGDGLVEGAELEELDGPEELGVSEQALTVHCASEGRMQNSVTGKCIERTSATSMIGKTCAKINAQRIRVEWIELKNGICFWNRFRFKNTNNCIALRGSSVVLEPCADVNRQKWTFAEIFGTPTSSNTVTYKNKSNQSIRLAMSDNLRIVTVGTPAPKRAFWRTISP